MGRSASLETRNSWRTFLGGMLCFLKWPISPLESLYSFFIRVGGRPSFLRMAELISYRGRLTAPTWIRWKGGARGVLPGCSGRTETTWQLSI